MRRLISRVRYGDTRDDSMEQVVFIVPRFGGIFTLTFKGLQICAAALLMAISTWVAIPAAAAPVSVAQERAVGVPVPEQAPANRLPAKLLQASRISSTPVLDGLLEEEVWRKAQIISDFAQREPEEHGIPSERTEARIIFDNEHLYIGFVMYDSEPQAIRATQLRRDSLRIPLRGTDRRGSGAQSDDIISVMLDTFHDRRNAFLFTVNALGTRSDATIRNEREVNQDWDERWEAAAQITDHGWEAELAIPWSILRYASSNPVWGLDFRREIRRTNEVIIWSNSSQDFPFLAVSQAGELHGLDDLTLNERFRLRPYITGISSSFAQRDDPISKRSGDIGIEDLKIKLTSTLTSQFTYNTDFAQVEVDEQRVNLTRFSILFPEKREFFLEAANNFSFGNTEGRYGVPPPSRLYFSRRIGLDDNGAPLPIAFGGKLTGKMGRGNLGLQHVRTGDSALTPGRGYTVLRWRQDVLGRSSVGAFFSSVEAAPDDFNRVAGLDANFTLFDYLNVSGFTAQSQDAEIDGNAWIGEVRAIWQTDLWEAETQVVRIEEDFRTELGFIPRTDVIKRTISGRWKPRPAAEWLRQVDIHSYVDHTINHAGERVARQSGGFVRLMMESGDSFTSGIRTNFDRLEAPFEVSPGITVAPDDYEFIDWHVGFQTYPGRDLSGSFSILSGGFFDGRLTRLSPTGTLRLSENMNLRANYTFNHASLPGGKFTVHLARLRTELSFSERWLTDALMQYSSADEDLSVFARLRYLYRPGDNFYLVYRQNRSYGGEFYGLEDRSLTAKLTYTLQW